MSSRELCIMACVFCRDPQFQQWAYEQAISIATQQNLLSVGAKLPDRTDECAKAVILHLAGVTSRNDLDRDQDAAQRFHDLVRKPFLEWKETQH